MMLVILSLMVAVRVGHQTLESPVPVSQADQDNYTSLTEGSAHGSILQFSGVTDDDTTIEDMYSLEGFEDDHDAGGGGGGGGGAGGGGAGGGGGSAIAPDVIIEDSSVVFDNLEVKCFRCHGDGISGCDVLNMLYDVQTYSVTCFGKCLNLSSGSTAVYDCAHDMVTKIDTCLQNGDTKMCFCTGDFCNGPSETDEFYTDFKKSVVFGNDYIPFEKSNNEDLSYRHYKNNYETIDVSNRSPNIDNDINDKLNNEGSGRKKYKNRKWIYQDRKKTNARIDNTFSESLEEEISVETSSNDFQIESSAHYPDVHETEVDVIISETFSGVLDNLTSNEVVAANAIGNDQLRVGRFKNQGVMKIRGVDNGTDMMTYSVLLLVHSVLLLQFVV